MKQYLLIIILFLLTGCGATPYQPGDWTMTGGYKDYPLKQKNTFKVSFSGNGNLKPQVASDYALLRGAVLTQEKGYKYFEVINRDLNIGRTNVGTGAAAIYSYKPTAYLTIKMIDETNRTHKALEAEVIIKQLTAKHNVTEY